MGEISETIAAGPFGTAIKASTFQASGVPVISGQHLRGVRLDDSLGHNFISEQHAARLKKANVFPGDLVFTAWGSIGQVAFIPKSASYDRYVLSQRQFYARLRRDLGVPEFYAYYFRSAVGQHKLLANASQTGVPAISRPVSYLRTLQVPLPPVSEQQRISQVLASFDDKIDSNRRLAALLEETAAAIFKARFVDFVGVEGCEESDIGPVPHDGHVGVLSDLCDTRYGYTASAMDEPVGPKFLRVKDINKQPWIDWATVPHCAIESGRVERYRLLRGDVVVARMADPGKVAFIVENVDAVCASYLVRLRPVQHAWSCFLYCYLRSERYASYVHSVMSGSVQKNINARVLTSAPIVIPTDTEATAFGDAVWPLYQLQAAAVRECATLVALRDTLLPKLISGQIRVPDTNDPDEVIEPAADALAATQP